MFASPQLAWPHAIRMSGLSPVPTSRKVTWQAADQVANARRTASRSVSPATSPVPEAKA